MALARALSLVVLLVALAAPLAHAAGPSGSGGALAQPLRQGEGGGGVAPAGAGGPASATEESGSERVATSAQEPTPTTPEGEEQPGEQQPGEEPAPEEEQPGTEPEEEVVVPEEPAPTGTGQAPADDGAIGFLPSTGLEVAALAAIGLGLLLAGAALRPRRRVAAGRR